MYFCDRMKFTNSILALFTSVMVFITSNGFVYEYYFCQKCNKEHQEVSLFEFGEVSHNHKCMSLNHIDGDEHHKCNNHRENKECLQHLNHTQVVFMSLEELFWADYGTPLPAVQTVQTFCDICNFSTLNEYIFSNSEIALSSFVPIKLLHSGGEVCQFFSCFRL